ncbi:hypothetical protein TVAG_136150 [Trichomonas vaginalis G3]|uniref:TNFR-Cys domain-containing protein n=1 Tax=Trichomonas vaginalis (strain ATCC PRA-98 / G3) TaxID=412133 RepID=A2DJ97_TRIV3|nr:serine-type endopeptidase protein [Trichomonas vaginalis G3]EAY19484.1 hypothetical protein TVAG_136150 [Trichomonas vaginalis G3]KAI5520035.1 serine-type endopeptidase protein [Trichomonas vaginalis G3]|eukprot:XP_001580470.1 hypothetical protein [Trichomonas vaginalis G3]
MEKQYLLLVVLILVCALITLYIIWDNCGNIKDKDLSSFKTLKYVSIMKKIDGVQYLKITNQVENRRNSSVNFDLLVFSFIAINGDGNIICLDINGKKGILFVGHKGDVNFYVNNSKFVTNVDYFSQYWDSAIKFIDPWSAYFDPKWIGFNFVWNNRTIQAGETQNYTYCVGFGQYVTHQINLLVPIDEHQDTGSQFIIQLSIDSTVKNSVFNITRKTNYIQKDRYGYSERILQIEDKNFTNLIDNGDTYFLNDTINLPKSPLGFYNITYILKDLDGSYTLHVPVINKNLPRLTVLSSFKENYTYPEIFSFKAKIKDEENVTLIINQMEYNKNFECNGSELVIVDNVSVSRNLRINEVYTCNIYAKDLYGQKSEVFNFTCRVTNCINGYYNSGYIICTGCDYPCSQCTSKYSCTGCSEGYFLYKDKCKKDCNMGTFPNYSTRICDACNNTCQSCDSLSYCYSCKNGYYLDNNKCARECSPGKYFPKGQNRCYYCNYPCKECDFSSTNCTSCRDGYYLQGNTCVRSCNLGFFANHITKICEPCDEKCTECNESATKCSKCTDGYYLKDTECVSSCGSNYYLNETIRRCEFCQSSCYECSGPYSNQCLSCTGEYNSRQDLHQCLNNCGDYYFGNENICKNCAVNCKNCQSQTECIKCEESFYLQNGKCQPKCNDHNYGDNHNICHECSRNCSSCSILPNFCTSCYEGYFLQGSICVQNCEKGYYSNSKRECVRCMCNCDECSSQTKCDKCSPGFSWNGISCVSKCLIVDISKFYECFGWSRELKINLIVIVLGFSI